LNTYQFNQSYLAVSGILKTMMPLPDLSQFSVWEIVLFLLAFTQTSFALLPTPSLIAKRLANFTNGTHVISFGSSSGISSTFSQWSPPYTLGTKSSVLNSMATSSFANSSLSSLSSAMNRLSQTKIKSTLQSTNISIFDSSSLPTDQSRSISQNSTIQTYLSSLANLSTDTGSNALYHTQNRFSTASEKSFLSTQTSGTPYFGPVLTTIVTVISGYTADIPAYTGGDLTTPFLIPTTGAPIPPTGPQAKSSATEVSKNFDLVIPLVSGWIKDPNPAKAQEAIKGFDNFIPGAAALLGSLPNVPEKDLEPCGHRKRSLQSRLFGGLFKSLFNTIKCVIDNASKIKDDITSATDEAGDAVKKVVTLVKDELSNIKPQVDALNDAGKDHQDDPDHHSPSASKDKSKKTESPSTTSSSSLYSSTSSCSSKSTIERTVVSCIPMTIGSQPTTTTSCSTLTSAVTGCNIDGSDTTTVQSSTSSCTGSQVSACNVICSTPTAAIGNKRATQPAACVSQCSMISAPCGASEIHSTTFLSTSSIELCTPGCYYCGYERYSTGFYDLPPAITPRAAVVADKAKMNSDPPNRSEGPRALPEPVVGSPGDFIMEEVQNAWRLPQPELNSFIMENSAITDDLLAARVSWAVVDLWGCTSVIVISRKRVWLSHFWEHEFSDPDQSSFDVNVTSALKFGGKKYIARGLDYFANPNGHNKDFVDGGDNPVRAFIITPSWRSTTAVPFPPKDENHLIYPDRVQKLKSAIIEVLYPDHGANKPALIPNVEIIPYRPLNKDPTLDKKGKSTFPQGKVSEFL
jgi:hypothetical protein